MKMIKRTHLAAATAAVLIALVSTAGAHAAAAATAPQLTGGLLTLSSSTIDPAIDGYRDTLGIAVAKYVTGASGDIPLSGKVAVERGSTILASYPITTSATETYSWSGRIHHAIVPGAYTVSATIVGPNTVITKRATFTVSRARLVSHRMVVTMSAQDFFQHSYSAPTSKGGCTAVDAGAISCSSRRGVAAVGSNYVAVPASVLRFAGYRQYSASVTVTISRASVVRASNTYWEWDGTHHHAFVAPGAHTTSVSSFGPGQDTHYLKFRVDSGSTARFDQVSISYLYWILA